MNRSGVKSVKSLLLSFGNDFLQEIVEEELSFVSNQNNSLWALASPKPGKIQIHFGPFVVFTILPGKIWLALDRNSYNRDIDSLRVSKVWQVDQDDYPQYKLYGHLSQNGYLSNGMELQNGGWEKFREYHFSFLRPIAKKQRSLDEQTIANHDLGLNIYLRLDISDSIPFPSYVDIPDDKSDENLTVPKPLRSRPSVTHTDSSVTVRIGQAYFRELLLQKSKKCALCSIDNAWLLRASHIKAWRASTNEERLDENNGLLLCANHDAAFDSGLLSFGSDGSILVSSQLSSKSLDELRIEGLKINIEEPKDEFLDWHRNNVFKHE